MREVPDDRPQVTSLAAQQAAADLGRYALVEALVGLRVGDACGAGGVLEAVEPASERLVLRFRVEAGRTVTVWIAALAEGVKALRRSRHFAIGYSEHELANETLGLVEVLAGRLLSQEQRSEPRELIAAFERCIAIVGSDALEWLAVEANLKPVARLLADEAGARATQKKAERAGLVAEWVSAPSYLAGFGARGRCSAARATGIVFVGRSPEELERAVAAERRIMVEAARGAGEGAEVQEAVVALGRALGYPSCCVEFFAHHRGKTFDNAKRRQAALAATSGPPSPLLNNRTLERSIISHFVCRYDCEPSIAYASALLDEHRARAPRRAAELLTYLRDTLELLAVPP